MAKLLLGKVGREMLEIRGQGRSLTETDSLKRFFKECGQGEFKVFDRGLLRGFKRG
jgi:hypothetical protein